MKKSIATKDISEILDKYCANDGLVTIKDIYSGETVDEILNGRFINSVEAYLDVNCSNGYFSRWTNFGDNLYNSALDFIEEIKESQFKSEQKIFPS